jgi:aldose 1-epimerase
LAEGRYRFEGVDYQVAITEPDKGNAIHGLLRWRCWEVVRQESNRVTMGIRLYPLAGYPFLLDVMVDYVLDNEGLTVTTTAVNRGEQTCPYGCGQHPYLSPGGGLIDDAVLCFAAGTRIVTDPHRQLPTGTELVAGGCFDFSQGRQLGDQRIDFAFTDLARDDAGRAWVRLDGPDGMRAELWVDGSYPIVELFTGDTLSLHRRRRGLGAEPMTCPPNAFQSGEGVRRLAPGQAVTTRWGARLHAG